MTIVPLFQDNIPPHVQNAAANRLINDIIPREINQTNLVTLLVEDNIPPDVQENARARLAILRPNQDTNNTIGLTIPDNILEWQPTEDKPIQNTECPITAEVPQDPIYIIDEENNSRHQFEKAALEEWFERSNKNPLTSEVVTSDMIRRPKKTE